MKNTIATTLKTGVVALFLITAAGCATTKDVQDARAAADKAAQAAAAAQTAADTAAKEATSAKSAADGAQSTANQALQASQSSQACCDATNEKIDRMFKKSVSK